MKVEIVSPEDIRPAAYNPREADPARLQLVALSLRKLGFVLPMYVTKDGEILSGHQRYHVATTVLGATKLPVVRLPDLPLQDRQAVNILFNRSTCDMRRTDRSSTTTPALEQSDVIALAESINDKEVDTPAFLRCVDPVRRYVRDLVAKNDAWDNYARNVARTLRRSYKVEMPVILSGDHILNGIGRVQHASETKADIIETIPLAPNEAEFARLMLNLLSMEFSIHTHYRDVLRFNSFRRAMTARFYLGLGFIEGMAPGTQSKDFDITKPDNRKRWVKHYGPRVIDFGSGLGESTTLLRRVGIRVASFEPFKQRIGDDGKRTDQIDQEGARKFCRTFLDDIADGRQFTSVFCSSVLNSVPFAEDREHILTILAALCGPRTRCYLHTKSIAHASYTGSIGGDNQNPCDARTLRFALDYEPGIILGDFTKLPKVQKFFTPTEFYALAKTAFDAAKVTMRGQHLHCVAARPKPIDPAKLRAAIEFEFDLPYPDGSRLNLVHEALQVFEKRLGISLAKDS